MPGGAHENMKAWEPEEDQIILEQHSIMGPLWSKIIHKLPGRTVSSVRNRWQRIEKGRKAREAGLGSRNKCLTCGEIKRGHVCVGKAGGGPQVELAESDRTGVTLPERSRPVSPIFNPFTALNVDNAFKWALGECDLNAPSSPRDTGNTADGEENLEPQTIVSDDSFLVSCTPLPPALGPRLSASNISFNDLDDFFD